MTEPLLNSTDFAKFNTKDEDWFLGAIGDTIRDHCGWHIFPIVSDVAVEARIGAAGLIILPTINLLSVEQILCDGTELTIDQYVPHTAGYLEVVRWRNTALRRTPYVSVDFTHGFETLPNAVAEVGYELAARTIEKPAGIVTEMARGPSSFTFQEFGAVLSDDQKARLAPYTIVRV